MEKRTRNAKNTTAKTTDDSARSGGLPPSLRGHLLSLLELTGDSASEPQVPNYGVIEFHASAIARVARVASTSTNARPKATDAQTRAEQIAQLLAAVIDKLAHQDMDEDARASLCLVLRGARRLTDGIVRDFDEGRVVGYGQCHEIAQTLELVADGEWSRGLRSEMALALEGIIVLVEELARLVEARPVVHAEVGHA